MKEIVRRQLAVARLKKSPEQAIARDLSVLDARQPRSRRVCRIGNLLERFAGSIPVSAQWMNLPVHGREVTSYETCKSMNVSFAGNDTVFRLTQHAEMPKENKFGIRHPTLPIRFRQYRKALDLTQEDLANQLQTTKSRISKKENGEETFSGFFLEAFAKAVDKLPEMLIASDEVAELLEAWAKCEPGEKQHFLKSIKRAARMPERVDEPPGPPSAPASFPPSPGDRRGPSGRPRGPGPRR